VWSVLDAVLSAAGHELDADVPILAAQTSEPST